MTFCDVSHCLCYYSTQEPAQAKPVEKKKKKEKQDNGHGGGGVKEVGVMIIYTAFLPAMTACLLEHYPPIDDIHMAKLIFTVVLQQPTQSYSFNRWCLSFHPKSLPGFISERMHLYEELKKESDSLLARRVADSQAITVQLPDGQNVQAQSWITTPYQLACGIR